MSRETFEAPEPGADGGGPPRAGLHKNETYTGEGSAVSGVLGPDSPANTAGGGGTDYELEEADVQYALNRVVESTNTAPGAIEKLSVARHVSTKSKVPADLVDSLEVLVRRRPAGSTSNGATSLRSRRVPFDDTQAEAAEEGLKKAEEAEAAEASAARMQTIALGVLLFVMLLVAFFLYRRSAKQRRKRAQLLAELQMASLPAALPGASASYPRPASQRASRTTHRTARSRSAATLQGCPQEPAVCSHPRGRCSPRPRPTSSDQQRVVRQAQLAEMVDQQPDESLSSCGGWLDDGRGGRSVSATITAASDLSGTQKSAVLLMALGTDAPPRCCGQMREHEVAEIMGEVAKLGDVPAAVMNDVLAEFENTSVERRNVAVGSPELARELLEVSLGVDRANQIVDQMSTVFAQPFDFMTRVDPRMVLSYLRDDTPQTIALVLAHVPSDVVTRVLVAWRGGQRESRSESPRWAHVADVVNVIEETLRRRLSGDRQYADLEPAGGVDRLVEVLTSADPELEQFLLEGLEEHDPTCQRGPGEDVRLRRHHRDPRPFGAADPALGRVPRPGLALREPAKSASEGAVQPVQPCRGEPRGRDRGARCGAPGRRRRSTGLGHRGHPQDGRGRPARPRPRQRRDGLVTAQLLRPDWATVPEPTTTPACPAASERSCCPRSPTCATVRRWCTTPRGRPATATAHVQGRREVTRKAGSRARPWVHPPAPPAAQRAIAGPAVAARAAGARPGRSTGAARVAGRHAGVGAGPRWSWVTTSPPAPTPAARP